MGFVFALMAATSWALTAVLARLGLRHLPSSVGTLVSLAVSFLLIFGITLAFDRGALLAVPVGAFGWFALHGMFNYLLGRLLNFTSVGMAGVNRATPIIATSPLFSALLSAVFLREPPNLAVLLGTFAVVAGIALIVSDRRVLGIPEKGR